jgi:hypothetical protein
MKMKDCLTLKTVFGISNLVQLGIVMKILTPPIICPSSCLLSAVTGSTLIPCFVLMEHITRLHVKCIYIILMILLVGFIPFLAAVSSSLALRFCFDENWVVWLIQGSTIPVTLWTTLKMFLSIENESNLLWK